LFFFQAEDGIRAFHVTGVQTCALPILREHMQYEIKQLHDQLGVTVVYVTHDQSEALTMSDRIAVFHEGRIQQIADPRTIYEHPRPEERRVGQERRCRQAPTDQNSKYHR